MLYSMAIATLLFLGQFHFSEGKPCPEESKAHTSRCDSYFRCVVLPSKTHVWIPTKCERGLIYEPDLRLCVLPGDDWECTLGDASPPNADDNNIYGIDSLGGGRYSIRTRIASEPPEVRIVEDARNDLEDATDYIEVKTVVNSAKNGTTVSDISDQPGSSDEDGDESSGDGGMEEDDAAAAAQNEVEVKNGSAEISSSSSAEIPAPSKVDPSLMVNLQRLSQLIDGLKSQYQTSDAESVDLRPDQLNAFLAHYNIRSEFGSVDPAAFDKRPLPSDGRIENEIFRQILKKQQILQKTGLPSNSTSSALGNGNFVRVSTISKPSSYASSTSDKEYRKPEGYPSSQIFVNRPEGNVVFGVASTDQYQPRPQPQSQNDIPRISEETLKTVLELSKQMIANQNIRQVIPSNAFYQPMYVPVPLISPPQQQSHQSYPYGAGGGNEVKYEKISSSSSSYPRPGQQKPTTLVQNSVLPITISASENGMIPPRPISEPPTAYQSGSKLDSYGNELSADNFQDYPAYSTTPNPNELYSTSLHPPLNYDLAPYGTPPSTHNVPDRPLDNAIYDLQQQYASLSYPSNPNPVQETPKPMQSIAQFFSQSNFPRPANPQSSLMQSPSIMAYSSYNSKPPAPPKIRPINPSSVNIRPNSIQTSGLSALGSEIVAAAAAESPESHFTYNQNSVNNEIVNDLLASNVDQNVPTGNNNAHLVNLGGNFISYDVYKNQILPALGGSGPLSHKVEVVTCVTGVRQANTTDCTKYYVCSKKDGKVLSYSCPPYTGFNPQTHICDAKTYAFCNPQAIYNRFTVTENRKIQMDAIQALEEAKRIRDEAVQAQNLANLIRLETQKVINNTILPQRQQGLQEPLILSNYLQNNRLQFNTPNRITAAGGGAGTGLMPSMQQSAGAATVPAKRRRFRCSDGGKVPDPQSNVGYYVCFKTADGKMKRHKMTCTPGLVFCSKILLCTLPRKCNS